MLLRRQNLLGYKHNADDVVEYFVQKAVANGMDIIRIFDALNDPRNVETAIRACKKEGGHAQATVCYTTSPVHTLELFVKDAKLLESMGADSICIKDMAGLLLPYAAYDLVKAIRQNVSIPIALLTHYTSGVGSMTYLKAIEAGVDIIDCAISPLSMGTSQPPTEPFVATLKNTQYDTGLDLNKLSDIAEYFKPLGEKYIENGLLDTKMLGVDVNALKYQVPGGMLSNLISQLKQANASEKYEEVLNEIPRVRKDFGYPPLVTPTSQIVGTQAVMNVIMGERYKMIPKESKALVKGEYGKTPAPVSPEIIKKILGNEEQITCRPADLILPELESNREKIKKYSQKDEDILSYALLPKVSEDFFKMRLKGDLIPKAESIKESPVKEKDETPDDSVVAAISAIGVVLNEESDDHHVVIRSIRPMVNPWVLSNRLNR